MKIDVEQVWEYEFKPTDTMRLLHAFKNNWELKGDEITLERRGDRIFAVRKENKQTDHDKRMREHYEKLAEYYNKKYGTRS